MPPIDSKKLRRLKNLKSTRRKSEFSILRNNFRDRISILSQGDSWFAYPHKNLIGNAPNLIRHLSHVLKGRTNFYTMASNGDEAVDMISGKKKHELIDIIRWHSKKKNRTPLDLILFSGGGNDVVGKNDFERFLISHKDSFTRAEEYINTKRLNRKIDQIGLAFHELIDIRDHYSAKTIIMTHTYDYPFPSLQGAEFLKGLFKTKSWMKPYMDKAKIPEEFQRDIVTYLMKSMAQKALEIENERDGFIVVDSRGTLTSEDQWENEIHPNSDGFELIAEKMLVKIYELFPEM